MRLIDADEARDAVLWGCTYAKKINMQTGKVERLFEAENKALEEAAQRIAEIEPMDAVEVVRCKDCRHWVGKHRSQCPVKCKTFGYCDLWEQYAGNGEKFFCAYGERREDV